MFSYEQEIRNRIFTSPHHISICCSYLYLLLLLLFRHHLVYVVIRSHFTHISIYGFFSILFLFFIGFWRVPHSHKCSHCSYCSYCTLSLQSSLTHTIFCVHQFLSLFLASCLSFTKRTCFVSMLFMLQFWLTIFNDVNIPIYKSQLMIFVGSRWPVYLVEFAQIQSFVCAFCSARKIELTKPHKCMYNCERAIQFLPSSHSWALEY